MSSLLSRRDLLRRGAALAGGLLASQAFVLDLAASPDPPALSARLVPFVPISGQDGAYTFELGLVIRNDGAYGVTVDGSELTLSLSVARDPNATAVPMTLMDQSLMARSMPSNHVDLVAQMEMQVTTFMAWFPPGFAAGPAWSGQLLRGEATVAVWVAEQRRLIPCAPLELPFPVV